MIEGKGGIKATVVAHSISEAGQEILTYELEYPRFIHAEFMTHRQFSRNAASSRAIPIEKMIEQVLRDPAKPIHWGKNQAGMKAKEELGFTDKLMCDTMWGHSSKAASEWADHLHNKGLHKQATNRILEPYQFIKVVCTATEYENFFYLRNHADAQPEIAELARVMLEAREMSIPVELKVGEWHLPYVSQSWLITSDESVPPAQNFWSGVAVESDRISLGDAIKISSSLCAQVSYRKADVSIDKALKIYDMLVNMKPVHASPFEHQATPMGEGDWTDGVTHVDVGGSFWSGNFKGWIQNRQLIKGHVYNGK
ncbi:FAD-dependent thymidylate synthase [bacterium]|nr:FAD-dependent thymidylate synthase [bacterium]